MTTDQTRQFVLAKHRTRNIRHHGLPFHSQVQEDFELMSFNYVNTPLVVDPAVGRDASVGVMMERAWLRDVLDQARRAHEQRPIWAGGSR